MTYSPSHCCLLNSLASCEMKIRLPDSRTLQLTSHIIFFVIWKVCPDVWTNVFTPAAVVSWVKLRLRFRLVEKVELVKTTQKSYGFNADKICCHWDPVLIDRLLMSSTGSNVKVSKSSEACSNRILLIECLASRTLSIKIFMLRMKFNIFYFCLPIKTMTRNLLLSSYH